MTEFLRRGAPGMKVRSALDGIKEANGRVESLEQGA